MSLRWNLRLRPRIAPGIHVNLTKKGLNSISFGIPGVTYNLPIQDAKRKPRTTVSLPGTGIRFVHTPDGKRVPLQSRGNFWLPVLLLLLVILLPFVGIWLNP